MNSELKVFARLFSKSESSYFVFLFYKRYIILNSLAACRALYKCINQVNSELKVFAKLSSESVSVDTECCSDYRISSADDEFADSFS